MKIKTILLLGIIGILLGGAIFMTYIITTGSDPLVIFNSKASEDNDGNLLADNGLKSPTPTFKSTSPAVKRPTLTPTQKAISLTVSPTLNASPTITRITTPTPTPLTELPVAGGETHIVRFILGGGLLVFLSLLF